MKFLALVFAHLLGDYPLQGEFLAKMKCGNPILMATHCGIWTGCICVAAHLCGLDLSFAMVVFLFVGHYALDKIKCAGIYAGSDNPLGLPLAIDQVMHLGQILYFFWWAQ